MHPQSLKRLNAYTKEELANLTNSLEQSPCREGDNQLILKFLAFYATRRLLQCPEEHATRLYRELDAPNHTLFL